MYHYLHIFTLFVTPHTQTDRDTDRDRQ